MLRAVIFAVGLAFALVAPAYAADPQKFQTEDSATKFCKPGMSAADLEKGLSGVQNTIQRYG